MSRIPSRLRKLQRPGRGGLPFSGTSNPAEAKEVVEENVEDEVAATEDETTEVAADSGEDSAVEAPDYSSMSYGELRKLVSPEEEAEIKEQYGNIKAVSIAAYLTEKAGNA